MTRLLAATLLSFTLSACGYYHKDKSSPPPAIDLKDLGGDATLSYETVASAVFAPYCTHCHGDAGGNAMGINLETYANVKASLSDVRDAVSSGAMPLGSSLPDDRKTLLLAWIDAGAPETSNLPLPGKTPAQPPTVQPAPQPDPQPAPAPVPEPAPVPQPAPTPEPAPAPVPAPQPTPPDAISFDEVRAKIFQPFCVQCHAKMSTYDNVKAKIDKIQQDVESDKMPKGGPALSLELKQLLENWIAQGSPETVERTSL